MKKSICILLSATVLIIVLGICAINITDKSKLTESEQETVDMIWDCKQNWEMITGYFSGNGECNYVSFGEYNGHTVFTVYNYDEQHSTIASNSYYVTNNLSKMDSQTNSMYVTGLFKGTRWDENSTKEALENIYLDYLNSK